MRDYRVHLYRTQFGTDMWAVLRSRLRHEDAGATPVRLPLKSPGDRFGGVGDPSGPEGAYRSDWAVYARRSNCPYDLTGMGSKPASP